MPPPLSIKMPPFKNPFLPSFIQQDKFLLIPAFSELASSASDKNHATASKTQPQRAPSAGTGTDKPEKVASKRRIDDADADDGAQNAESR